jgi:hypothetical protein
MAISLLSDQAGITSEIPPQQQEAPEAPAQSLLDGIPQSSPFPLLTPDFLAGENPWDVQQREAQAKAQEQAAKDQDQIDRAVLEPEKAFTGEALSFDPDPKRAAMLATNDLVLSKMYGPDIPMNDTARRLKIIDASASRFGEVIDTEEGFHARLVKDATDRRDQLQLLAGRDDASHKASLFGMLADDAVKGADWRSTFLNWQKAAASDPRFDPAKLDVYEGAAEDLHNRFSDEVEQARPFADEAFKALLGEGSNSVAYGTNATVNAIKAAPSEVRPMVMALLDRQAQEAGSAEANGWHHLQTAGRGVMEGLTGTVRYLEAGDLVKAQQVLETIKPGDTFGGRFDHLLDYARGQSADSSEGRILGFLLEPLLKNNVATAESIAEAKQGLADQMDTFQIQRQMEQVGTGLLSPLRPDSWIGKYSYGASKMAGQMLPMLLLTKGLGGGAVYSSAVGAGSMYGMMADQNQQALQAQYPAMNFAQSYQIGREAAGVQSAMFFASDMLTLGLAPGLGKSLKSAEAPLLANFAKNVAIHGASQNALMGASDLALPVIQALDKRAPAVDWHSVFYGPGGWIDQRADVAATLLPFIVMGAGGQALRSKASLPELQKLADGLNNETLLKAAGIGEEGRARVAAATDPAAKLDIFEKERKASDPAIAAEGRKEMDAQVAEAQEREKAGQRAGIIPTFRVTGDGIEVRDSATGDAVGTAADASGAMKLANDHYEMVRNMNADRIAAMASQLEGAKFTTGTNEEGSRSTEAEFSPGDVRTPAQKIAEAPEDEARVMERMRIEEQAGGGNGDMTGIIAGENVTEFKGRIRNTINKLFAGSSVLDVFHEEAHGFFREALDRGRLTVDDTLQYLRSLQASLNGRKTKAGQPLEFIPAEGPVSFMQLDEAVSKVMEAEILRNRDGGLKRTEPGRNGGLREVPSALVTRNLTATARTAPEATRKFAAFANAVRGYFGQALHQALAIKKGIREGKINEADHEAFISKLLGLDAQDEHDAEAQQHTRDMLAAGGDPFSIRDRRAMPGEFPEKLSNVIRSTTVSKLTGDPEFQAAKKGGDPNAAAAVVRRVAKMDKVVSALKARVDPERPVKIVPVMQREGSRLNLLPLAYAAEISRATGWPLDLETVKESGKANTGATVADRTSNLQEFSGPVEKGTQYVLVDDTFTSGDTLVSLHQHVTEGGGEVSAITALSAGRYQDYLAHRPQDVAKLLDRAGTDRDGFRREVGFPVEQLTGAEVYRLANLDRGWKGIDGLRSRLDPEGSARGAAEDHGGVRPPGLEEGGQVDPALSIRPAAMADALIGDASKLIKEPRARIAFFSKMVKSLGDLRRETDEIGKAFGKDYVRKAVVDPDTTARIKREAGIWQAFRRDELEDAAQAKHMGILSNDDLTKLKAQPVHAELSTENPLHGRLRSSGKAEERMRQQGQTELIHGGDYDGSEGVSRSVFGGTLAPDQAAQELYDHGLIKEPTPDAMWDALKREGESVANMKRYRKAAEDDLRKAKVQAKQEADERVKAGLDAQKRDYSTTARLLRALAFMDGVDGALPPEIRGKLGGHTQLAKMESDKARLEYLQGRIAKAGELVDSWVKKNQRADLDKLIERSRPNKNAPGESKRGKIGPEAHRLFAWAEKYHDLSEAQTGAERITLEKEQERIDSEAVAGVVHPEALQLANRMRVLDAVGDFDGKSAEDQMAGLGWLHDVYSHGRDAWQSKEGDRLAEVAGLQRKMLESLAKQKGVTLPDFKMPEFDQSTVAGKSDLEAEDILRKHESRVKNAMAVHRDALKAALEQGGVGSLSSRQAKSVEEMGKEARTLLEGGTAELISFVQALERVLPPGHPLVERWNEAVGKAQDQKADAMLHANEGFNRLVKATVKGGLMAEKQRLWEMSTEQRVTVNKESGGQPVKIEVPLEDVPDLLDGSIHPGDYSLRPEDIETLQEAFDAHNARPDEGKGAGGKKAVKFLTVERRGEAKPIETKLTEMQAVSLLLAARQERYRDNLEKAGYTEEEIQGVQKQLSPEAREVMSWLGDYYRDNYEPVAATFREMFGIDLPMEGNYAPGRFEKGGIDNASGPDERLPEGGFRAGFTKTRAPSHNLEPALMNALSVFQGHLAETEHWRAFAPLVREMRGVMQNLEVAHAVEAVHGRRMLSVMNGWIQAFEQNGLKQRQKFDGMGTLIRGMQRNMAVMGLAFRMSSFLKNLLLPSLNVARQIGLRNWAEGMARFATGKIDYGRFANSDFITRREAVGFSPELRTAVAALRSEKPTRTKLVAEWSMRRLGWADAKSTALGAGIAWDHHYRENLAQNMSHEEADALAMRQTEDDVRRTAQPVELAEKSLYELSQSDAARLLFMFATESRKDYAAVQETFRRAWIENGAKGLLTNAEFRRTATVIWLSAGFASTVISRALSDAFDNSDDELFDDKHWSPGAVLASTMLGPFGGVPMVGNIADGFDRSAVSKAYQGIDAVKQIGKALLHREIPRDDKVGWVESQTKKVLDGVGMFNKAAADVAAVGNAIDQAVRAGKDAVGK